MKKYFLSAISLFSILAQGQVVIGSTASTTTEVKDYVGLEVRSDNKQGVQLPMVAITDITSTTTPVANPIDGMMVYNFNSTVPQGVFIWSQKANDGNGMWVQMADTSNIISSMLMKSSEPYSVLRNTPMGEFASLLSPTYKVVANEIGATFSPTEGLTLPANSGYTITLALDIEAPNIKTRLGMGNSNIYLHKYTIKLQDKTGKTYAVPANVSDISVVGKNANSHSVYATFTFPLTLVPVTLFPYIAYENETNGGNGGSYYRNRPTGNTGEIIIKSARMHIERGILAL